MSKTADKLTEAASNKIQETIKKVDENKGTADQIKKQIEELEAQRKRQSEEVNKIREESEKAKANLLKAKEDYAKAKQDMDTAGQKIDKSVQELKESGEIEALVNESTPKAEEKEPEEAPAPASPVKKIRPQTPVSSADYEKKEKQREKFQKIAERVEGRKNEAAAMFKKGDYIGANKIYKAAATLLEEILEDFPLFKKEISQLEATIFNNIAFCYGKDKMERQEVEYTTKVIDRALYLDDTNVLVKAYLRRGLAYEQLEKYKLACNDLHRVKELQPYNQQAQNAMTRCLKFIKQDEGIDYIPKNCDIELPKMEGIRTAEQQIQEEKDRLSPKKSAR